MSDNDNQGNSSAAKEQHLEGRTDSLNELFDAMGPSASADQQEMRKLFNPETFNGAVSHSPMLLRGRTKLASPEDETLTDQVRRIVGRR